MTRFGTRFIRELDRRLHDVEQRLTSSNGRTGEIVAVSPLADTVDVQLNPDDPTSIVYAVPVHGTYAVPEVGHQTVLFGDVAPVAHAPVSPLPAEAPPAPTGLTIQGAPGGIQVAWSPVNVLGVHNNLGSYDVQLDTAASFDSDNLFQVNVAATSKNIAVPFGGIPWFARVRAVNYRGVAGNWSDPSDAATSLEALTNAIGTTEMQEYSVTDTKFIKRATGWPLSSAILDQSGPITMGIAKYRLLGDIGGLVVMTFEISVAGTGVAASDIRIYGTGPSLVPSGGFVYGSVSYYRNAGGIGYVCTPQIIASHDGFNLFPGYGAATTRLGQVPSFAVAPGDYCNGHIIYEAEF